MQKNRKTLIFHININISLNKWWRLQSNRKRWDFIWFYSKTLVTANQSEDRNKKIKLNQKKKKKLKTGLKRRHDKNLQRPPDQYLQSRSRIQDPGSGIQDPDAEPQSPQVTGEEGAGLKKATANHSRSIINELTDQHAWRSTEETGFNWFYLVMRINSSIK